MWTRSIGLTLLGVLVAWPVAAQNAAETWSLKAQNAITAGRSPASSQYLLALVHAAMYDAAVAIDGRYRPFRVAVDVTHPASAEAAVATAAYRVLRHRLPALAAALDAEYSSYLSTLPDGAATSNGAAAGTAIAVRWLELRTGDRFDDAVGYEQPPRAPGVWEPTAPAPPVDVTLSQVVPYVMTSARSFRPRGPRPRASRPYARAFDEVFIVGRSDSISRTPEQLEVARFWAEHTAVQWSRNLRQLTVAAQLDVVNTARMLAMVHVASADAVVGCFDAKYHYLAWRPVQAIQRADTDGNLRTVPDLTWNALLNVNHPEYPSAHACWTTAVTDTLASFFGTDEREFWLDSTVTGTRRRFSSFSEVAREVGDARVWAGLHFRFSVTDGASIGRQVARLVERHFPPASNRMSAVRASFAASGAPGDPAY